MRCAAFLALSILLASDSRVVTQLRVRGNIYDVWGLMFESGCDLHCKGVANEDKAKAGSGVNCCLNPFFAAGLGKKAELF